MEGPLVRGGAAAGLVPGQACADKVPVGVRLQRREEPGEMKSLVVVGGGVGGCGDSGVLVHRFVGDSVHIDAGRSAVGLMLFLGRVPLPAGTKTASFFRALRPPERGFL